MESLLLPSETVFRVYTLLVTLFRRCLSPSTFPICYKYDNIHTVPKNVDRCNPSNNCLISVISCFFWRFWNLSLKGRSSVTISSQFSILSTIWIPQKGVHWRSFGFLNWIFLILSHRIQWNLCHWLKYFESFPKCLHKSSIFKLYFSSFLFISILIFLSG